nr:ABC transporter substrate-binding protein [uncultured Desulfobacter sp.]
MKTKTSIFKKASLMFLVLAAIGCTSVCTLAQASDPVYGGTLRYGLQEDPANWSPHNTMDCQSQVIMAQVWSGLLRYNNDEKIVGDLAESWEWKDPKTLEFKLRKNVKWHNGDKLTADQVVKSENLRLDPKIGIDAKTLADIIEKWEVVDDYTVRLSLKRPDVTVLRWLTIVPGKDFIIHPDWDEKTCGRSPETTIGTGPFKFKSYEPGVSVELEKNPDYFIKGLPYLDGIMFRIITDAESRLTGLMANELDMVEYIDFQSLTRIHGREDVYVSPGGQGFYGCRLALDLAKEPTNDINVRRALNYAVNRSLIVNAVLNGEGEPIWGGFIPKDRFGYAEELEGHYSYDPEKAKQLLAKAGWKDTDNDGKVDKNGKPMVLKFLTYGPSWWSQVGEILQANLRELGVTVELTVKPWPEYRAMRTKVLELAEGQASEWDIVGGTLWGLDLSDMPIYMMPSGFINFNRYKNPEAQDLLRKAFATTDENTREGLFKKIQKLMLEDAPDITPCWITRSEVLRTSVKNFHHLGQDGCYGTLLWEAYLSK